ncbi:dihydrolipoamide acetyltransferase component of pyruvate dehydrogenase complex [Paractinoplanes abujensis]|uniref:Dihydrolipoamide acetyltransferase component of pyruvate dehydrogenase complex n=1 Tax=Paractinoplanes abujensis TaxID=882441 RepID=A0A7W7CWA4_9ACTN|nr:2-oxoglutarate dehydrogenase, E2 component, dihydrolipoamide succinyltransferase [Actinoplanes abujensis]MBB4694443.1 2-oxoglutarate dehydrogenase E2 component (dihydrolipoamide succinyltransferase) [Actinoplanes abujensis]GID20344.1 dihydrolipoamide acetyltransferase component of pyruvate dehydrogenase complex [Actinoplanes abujensis]
MPTSVTMPRLGESVTEGTVTRWLKQEGERVEADEPLLEVSTDKVDTEIPSPAAGVLSRIVVGEDETADVGSELAVISGDGEDAGTSAPAPAQQQQQEEPEPPAPTEPSTEKPVEEEAPAPQAQAAAPSSGEGTAVKMPALGESVTEGTVTRWLKAVGDSVEVDEPLLEVSTDKVDTEIPSPVAGTVLEIKVQEDETADVGADLAIIGAEGAAPAPAEEKPAPAEEKPAPAPAPQQQSAPKIESAPAPDFAPSGESYADPAPEAETAKDPVAAEAKAEPPAPSQPRVEQASPNGAGDAGYVTPLVRKLAAEKGVDLSTLTGTGVGGRIRKQDVTDAADKAAAAKAAPAPAASAPVSSAAAPAAPKAKPEPSPLRGRTEKLTRTRATIARRMVESLQISAQLTTVVEVDVTKIAQLRQKAKADFQAQHGVKLSFLPFFALAAVEALRQHPVVNSSIDQEAGTVTYHDAEHLGMAVDTPKGLIVPVIKDAGDLNLAGLAKRIADVADRTRNNKIGPDEISGGTFTLTNTGSRGALFDTPIINQPQVGILGTGAVVKRAVVINDPELGEVIAPRSMVYLALSYDHRIVDGADAARFLVTLKERLEGGHFEGDLGLA